MQDHQRSEYKGRECVKVEEWFTYLCGEAFASEIEVDSHIEAMYGEHNNYRHIFLSPSHTQTHTNTQLCMKWCIRTSSLSH